MPAPVVPDASHVGASVQLAGSNFLSFGRASNTVAGDKTMNPAQLATPDKYNSEYLWPNGLHDEESRAENGTQASQLQQLAAPVFCDDGDDLEAVVPANTFETRIHHSDGNMHTYQPMQKRPKTQTNQSEHTSLSTPAVSKERTLNQIEMQILSAEKIEMFRNGETPTQKIKNWRKKHRPKIQTNQSKHTPLSTTAVPKERTLDQIEMQISSAEKTEMFRNGGTPAPKIKNQRKKYSPKIQTNQIEHTPLSIPVVPKERTLDQIEMQISSADKTEMIRNGETSAQKINNRRKRHRPKTQTDQLEHTPLPTTAVPKERTLDQIEVQISSAEKTEMMMNGKTPAQKINNWRKKHKPKVIRENKLSKVQKSDSKPDGKSPNQKINRSYVQKKRSFSSLEKCLAPASDRSISKGEGIAARRRTASVRRSLQFEPEEQGVQGDHSSIANLHHYSYKKPFHATSSFCSATSSFCSESEVQIEHGLQVDIANSLGRLVLNEYIHLPEVAPKPADVSNATSGSFSTELASKQDIVRRTCELDDTSKSSLCIEERVVKTVIEGNKMNLELKYSDVDGFFSSARSIPEQMSKVSEVSFLKKKVSEAENHNNGGSSLTGTHDSAILRSNALVPYGSGVMISYGRPLQLVKQQRPRAKVELDFETTRVQNLLMGEASEPDGTDVEERWWQQEREVFQGRANSFIARMRLVQGDRRFSPWKGSVVDSVVGVFLTQNVADHLSSSAYMFLAATFPPQSGNSNSKDDAATTKDNEQTIGASALGEKNIFDLFSNSTRPDRRLDCKELPRTYEKIHMGSKDNTSTSELIEGETYSFGYKSENGSVCNHQVTGIEHKEQQFPDFSLVELTEPTEFTQQMQIQKEPSFSQSVTLDTTQSRLSLSSGMPINFVDGISSASYQQLGGNFDLERSLTGKNVISEIECKRLQMAAINDYGLGKPGVPSSSVMPLILTIDRQQMNLRNEPNVSSTSSNSPSYSASPKIKNGISPLLMPFDSYVPEWSGNRTAGTTPYSAKTSTEFQGEITEETTGKEDEYTLKSGSTFCNEVPDFTQESRPKKKRTTSKKNTENVDWDKLRRDSCSGGHMKKRSHERRDSVDWEAVRCADVQRISRTIRERGMNNILAERIQNFLNRLVKDHGSIDLEWLRDIPPQSAKDYLLNIHGLGLKSVECVRLLTLHHLAFPVDTNVGRICVRLGWVPIQPLPESLQLHLLELYPVLETIQKYLWPRLCKLDQQTLYELHYQMITFGKVFCTKSKPNCNACPMRSECKHFASAFASARLALPAPQEKSVVRSRNQFGPQNSNLYSMDSTHLPRLEGSINARQFCPKNSEPIIEEPPSPREEEPPKTMENDIENFYEDGEIPTIKLNMEAFAQSLESCIKESNEELQYDDTAKALVAISTYAASIPVPKLKNVHRLRTEHCVYVLPDSHPLLQQVGLDQREPDDPTPYLLAIWTPDEINETSKAPKPCCDRQMEGSLCNNEICHNCTAEQENHSGYVRGTILVPCRSAMRGSFPLNGTYFQVNEVFADHSSSHNPVHVHREQLWNLQRRMVFFGTSVPTIFKGLTTEEIQQCFWRGYVCVRGFDMETRAPRPLCPHLHVLARPKFRKTARL